MSGIFLSHSSKDKPLVTKIAIDLTNRGFPVWLDSWEMETGDSLYDRIFAGIDEATFLILAISSHSVESRWVQRELNAALAKEDQLGRKVILPIKIDDCDPPLAVAERLYADLSGRYLDGLEQLESLLKKHRADQVEVPVERRLIPLQFTKGLYLKEAQLQECFNRIALQMQPADRISENQFVIAPDEDYKRLRDTLLLTSR